MLFTLRGDKNRPNLPFALKYLFLICMKSSVSGEFSQSYMSNADTGNCSHRSSTSQTNGESQSVGAWVGYLLKVSQSRLRSSS